MGKEVLAFGRVVVLVVLVADGANRHSLEERIAGQEVEHLPDRLGGPERIIRVRLALARRGAPGRGVFLITELEQGDVGELEAGEVREDVVRELEGFRLGGIKHELASRAYGRLVRRCSVTMRKLGVSHIKVVSGATHGLSCHPRQWTARTRG